MTRPGRHDMCLERPSDQGQIADQIQRFMTHGFVVIPQRLSSENPVCARGKIILQSEFLRQVLHLPFAELAVDDHHRVVEVAPLDEALVVKLFDFMQKTKGAGGSEFLDKFIRQ